MDHKLETTYLAYGKGKKKTMQVKTHSVGRKIIFVPSKINQLLGITDDDFV